MKHFKSETFESDDPYHSLLEETLGRLDTARAILHAIDYGDLLGTLPSGRQAGAHQTAVSLLGFLDRELGLIVSSLQSRTVKVEADF